MAGGIAAGGKRSRLVWGRTLGTKEEAPLALQLDHIARPLVVIARGPRQGCPGDERLQHGLASGIVWAAMQKSGRYCLTSQFHGCLRHSTRERIPEADLSLLCHGDAKKYGASTHSCIPGARLLLL